MELSLEHQQLSTSSGIEMDIGTEGKKADVGRVKRKVKRTACNCPNCVNRVPKRPEKASKI
jgi:hypothetical protein